VSSFSRRREGAIGLSVYLVYLVVRRLVVHDRGRRIAERNARAIVAFERRLGIHVEPSVQRMMIPHRHTMAVANLSYITLNVGLTVGWLWILFTRRDPRYHALRRAWMIATLSAQPIYVLRPTAPPRGVEGFTDTLREAGMDIDSGFVSQLYNPIAAMPSIHVAYAWVIGAGMADTARSRLVRRLAPAYAPVIALVVIATGNHFVTDVAAGAALGAASLRAGGHRRGRRRPR